MPGDSKGSMTKYKFIFKWKAAAVKVAYVVLGLFDLRRSWYRNIRNDLFGPRGYRAWLWIVTTAIGAYFTIYAVVVARHEHTINRAFFERNEFLTMVNSGSRTKFVAAMKNFGRAQTVSALLDPPLLNPFRWLDAEQPNMYYLRDWATHSLSACTKEECGTGTSDDDYRIDLRFANFEGADLRKTDRDDWGTNLSRGLIEHAKFTNAKLNGVSLSNSSLRYAELSGADLSGADLSDAGLECAKLGYADLRGADLRDARLRNADLRNADLRGADLRGAELGSVSSSADLEGAHLGGANLGGIRNWTPSQLQAAYWDERTEWPSGYVPPRPVNLQWKPCSVESD